jgi:peptidoglycan hydrolase CwlO-like protein
MATLQKGSLMKKVLALGLVVLAGLVVARKTHLASYARTLWSQVRQEAKAQVPVKFELDRIRNEIDAMDDDIRGMVSPIAEHMAGVAELKHDIEQGQSRLARQKASLLTMTQCLQRPGDRVAYKGEQVSAVSLRRQMQRDFSLYKQMEAQVATQEKLLAARQRALDAAREQLNKLIAKKDEFTIQLAQLEAEQQLIEAAGTGTDLRVNDSRASEIATALAAVRHEQEVARNKIRLLTGEAVAASSPGPEQPGASPDEVRAYLEGNAPAGGTRAARRD